MVDAAIAGETLARTSFGPETVRREVAAGSLSLSSGDFRGRHTYSPIIKYGVPGISYYGLITYHPTFRSAILTADAIPWNRNTNPLILLT